MPREHLRSAVLLAITLTAGFHAGAAGNTYYVATGGSDSNNGSIGSPFATIPKAISLVGAGDTIYVRGGTYNLSSRIQITKAGADGSPISLWAFPGETPILDFDATPTGTRGFEVKDDWWHFKGLTIERAGDNGVWVSGSNNTFEQLVLRYNQDSGLQLSGSGSNLPANNLILNTDSYENYDPINNGENADGFAAKFRELGPGNVFRGDRAWGNSDDGWDFWEAASGVTVENSWSFENGINIWEEPLFAGDGNGIKLGHDSGTHLVTGMLVWNNPGNGVDVNGNALSIEVPEDPIVHGVEVDNVTAYNNGNRNFRFDESYPHVLRNNVSLDGSVTINGPVDDLFNTWNGISVDDSDFLSLDDSIARGPRQADGSLPISDFLRLAPGSNLINAGIPVGLPYSGVAPDLGAFETLDAAARAMGDYNGDNVVDARDYTVWRNMLGQTGAGLAADGDDDELIDDDDYTIWKANFGKTVGGGGSDREGAGAIVGVPEPGSLVLLVVGAAFAAAAALRRQLRQITA